MTEAEWLASDDPVKMIAALEGRGSDRKFRLFAIAGCYLCPPRSRKPKRKFEVVVQFADGQGGLEQVLKEWYGSETHPSWPERPFEWAHQFAIDCHHNEMSYPPATDLVPIARDVFGNPFRPVEFPAEWLTDTVRALAKQMYESREFSAMPILADALQDAGCNSEDLLFHCRDTNQTHVRGCWVLDLILGKS